MGRFWRAPFQRHPPPLRTRSRLVSDRENEIGALLIGQEDMNWYVYVFSIISHAVWTPRTSVFHVLLVLVLGLEHQFLDDSVIASDHADLQFTASTPIARTGPSNLY